ncbi:hypothetical protein SDC9_163153 [bioreactor metagenome]|uniref:Uncharacterized protein n=1 Tax=bioreactor metagenome TaxID=1076179 RepID=A0A645FN16_9ZZZZ
MSGYLTLKLYTQAAANGNVDTIKLGLVSKIYSASLGVYNLCAMSCLESNDFFK